MKNTIYLLWLEGIHPSSLSTIPSLVELAAHGIDLHLTPLPLVEPGQCYYQAMTGMGAGKLGRFDAVRPENYTVQECTGIPEGALGCLLPDVLRKHKLAVASLEITASDALAMLASAGERLDCALIRFSVGAAFSSSELDVLIRQCMALAMPDAHLFVLTDVCSRAMHILVNVNDFLKDEGLLEVQEPYIQGGINWPQTLAYGLGTGQIWVNLRGREPQGVVSPGREYQDVCNALVHELSTNWLDPRTHEPVAARVFRRDEIYSGEFVFKAPDLITVYRPGYAASPKALRLELDGHVVAPQPVHTPWGDDPGQAPYARLIARGPELVNGFSGQAALIDLVPSIMYLLGLSIPRRIDGEVFAPMFSQSYLLQMPIERVEDTDELLSDEEEDIIIERLRNLGYMGE